MRRIAARAFGVREIRLCANDGFESGVTKPRMRRKPHKQKARKVRPVKYLVRGGVSWIRTTNLGRRISLKPPMNSAS
jgi:hypothetical protein